MGVGIVVANFRVEFHPTFDADSRPQSPVDPAGIRSYGTKDLIGRYNNRSHISPPRVEDIHNCRSGLSEFNSAAIVSGANRCVCPESFAVLKTPYGIQCNGMYVGVAVRNT